MEEYYYGKYIKYKGKLFSERMKQLGGSCGDICGQINKLNNIFVHGDCLDGLFTAYLLRKNCVVDITKFSFIAPGLNIIDNINKIADNDSKIGLLDLSLPDPDQIPNKGCSNNILTINDKKIVHILDHHFMTSKYKNICKSTVEYDSNYSTSGTIWNKINDKKIDEQASYVFRNDNDLPSAATRLNAYVSAVSRGDRGELSLSKDGGRDFMLYIGLQKYLDVYRVYKFSNIKTIEQKFADSGKVDPWMGFTNVIESLVESASPFFLQIVGAIEIVSVYNFLNDESDPNSNFMTRKGPLYDKDSHIIDDNALYVAKRHPADTILGQVLGITLKYSAFDPINYIIIYDKERYSKGKGRFMIRDVAVSAKDKKDPTDNAHSVAKKINPNDSGGHEKASSVGIPDDNAWSNMFSVPKIDDNKKFKINAQEEAVLKIILKSARETLGNSRFRRFFVNYPFEDKNIYEIVKDCVDKRKYEDYITSLVVMGINRDFAMTTCGVPLRNDETEYAAAYDYPPQQYGYQQQQYGYQAQQYGYQPPTYYSQPQYPPGYYQQRQPKK